MDHSSRDLLTVSLMNIGDKELNDVVCAAYKMGCDQTREVYQKRIEKLEAALKNISEGDIPRKVKIPFRDDGQSSKHDRCEHGQWFYEDCGCCIEDYARKALEGKDD